MLVSEISKQVVKLELTVPWEQWTEEASERKNGKYADLRARCIPLEMGGMGFAGKSMHIGIQGNTGAHKRKAISGASEAAGERIKNAVDQEGQAMDQCLVDTGTSDHSWSGRLGDVS